MPTLLQLPQVTLCCVDTRSPDLALYALQQCMQQATFGKVLFIGAKEWGQTLQVPENIDFVGIERFDGISAYSHFMLQRLGQYIHTSHALTIQWDGYLIRPGLWTDEFLDHDFIGAPWYHRPPPTMIGNGGFSLRSKRLLDALQSMQLPLEQPEDAVIGIHLRDKLEREHGISFAPLPLAQRFSCEYGGWREAFGFHGMHNFAHMMDDEQLQAWFQLMPDDILCTQHTRNLIKELMRHHRASTAKQLIYLRRRGMGWSQDQCLLWIRATWHQIARRLG